jgi:hypothetical protein
MAGALFLGEFQLDNTAGDQIADADYDITGFVGVSGTIRF